MAVAAVALAAAFGGLCAAAMLSLRQNFDSCAEDPQLLDAQVAEAETKYQRIHADPAVDELREQLFWAEMQFIILKLRQDLFRVTRGYQ